MNYEKLFHSMFPGFFDESRIKNIEGNNFYYELIMDLRCSNPKPASYSCPDNITFGEYHGEIEKVRQAVTLVDKEWVQLFSERTRVFCAFEMDRIASFCILEDWGKQDGIRIGGPGCVGTVPEYRKNGIGLEMVLRATNLLKEESFDVSWIHYTHLWAWYEKLGYQTILKWNCNGLFRV